MNPDFTDFDSQIAATLSSAEGTIKSYTIPRPKTNADLILAGVQSCFVAVETIEHLSSSDLPRLQSLVAASYQVLSHWGIALKPKKPSPAAESQPNDASEAPAPAPVAELLWPPLAPNQPKLPAVYTENYYLPRHPFLAWDAIESWGTDLTDAQDPSVPVAATDLMVFTGAAMWHAKSHSWIMQMELQELSQLTRLIWVCTQDVSPGSEIQND